MEKKIKIALAQISSKREDKKENLKKIERLAIKARGQGANLAIFPELSLTSYVVRDQIYELAETIPGPSTKVVENIAKKTGMYIIFGMPELSDKTKATIFNTAVLVGPEGFIGKYRKMYLPTHSVFEEKRYFRPGYQTAAFETSLGNIGLCICYDVFFPEVFRLTRLMGAQLITVISASPAVRRSYFEILTAARALENTVFLAFVNLVGVEDGLQFWGGSRLVSPTGDVLAKAKYDEEDLVICEVDYNDLIAAEAFIPTLRDLRPELFEELKRGSELL
ncbi:carbon-nitrogen hydrolase family protein [Candidatus Bathyarchaeota archaeon A05DMB-2]|jgi:predicted amidohydrolase|nr:carbon-nitrogen hydrolase family protein [Candidatus Bathyarchaeota archaeon A05DMB-2]